MKKKTISGDFIELFYNVFFQFGFQRLKIKRDFGTCVRTIESTCMLING